MKTFLSGYLTFLCAVGATLGTVFVAGMIKGSINTGHVDTALVTAFAWFVFLPILVCAAIMCGQTFTELMSKKAR